MCLWGAWEGYRWVWTTTAWTWPFPVTDITLPHLHAIVAQLAEPTPPHGRLINILWHAALFTAKEAVVGFAIGAIVGFTLGVLLAHFRVLQRGLMPYIVASQTIPILAIAPIVVIGLGSVKIAGWTPDDWMRVSVIAAYLTFFPVTVNTLRRRRHHRRGAVLDPGWAWRCDLELQPVLLARAEEPLGDEPHRSSARHLVFLAVVLAEKLIVRRAPEHLV